MSKERFFYLLEQYYHQQLTGSEWNEFKVLLHEEEEEVLEEVVLHFMQKQVAQEPNEASTELAQQRIDTILTLDLDSKEGTQVIEMKPKPVRILWRKWAWMAASVFLMVAGGIWYALNETKSPSTNLSEIYTDIDFQPGKDGGRLQLGDGHSVNLDSIRHPVVMDDIGQGVSLHYDQASARYVIQKPAGNIDPVYHTIETPNGRKYRLTLSDGTKVWLNAGSKLRFPLFFEGDHRSVYVSGEIYFEVAEDEHFPFVVNVVGSATKIEVLGTHFSVSSYPENNGFVTTLLEGKVRLFNDRTSLTLLPGQQALAGQDGQIQLMATADVDTELKDNYFSFTEQDLPSIMQELSRWYDIQVAFEGPVPQDKFSGKIGKDLSFAQVMEILGSTHIQYRIQHNRKVTIISKP